MTKPPTGLIVKGWTLMAHPLFSGQVDALVRKVKAARKKDPKNYKSKNATKRLAAIRKLAFEVIPSNPADPSFRQGATLGGSHKHWFRAKFYQQYRLFFRYDEGRKIIILGWVNDETTKRAYGSKTDAYRTFAKMLDGGNPPTDWDALLSQSMGLADDFDDAC